VGRTLSRPAQGAKKYGIVARPFYFVKTGAFSLQRQPVAFKQLLFSLYTPFKEQKIPLMKGQMDSI